MKTSKRFIKRILGFSIILCALLFYLLYTPSPPEQPDNLCKIFLEKKDWYEAALATRKKWGVPVQVPMAMMFQESSFRSDAEPPLKYALGFIPVGRTSTAYGYSQAKTLTWKDYVQETGNTWSSRDNFQDAIDFMGWFINRTHNINHIAKSDAYHQYLNYHEGWSGYQNKSHLKKNWLIKTAKKVHQRAQRYRIQYQSCKKALENSSFFHWLFSFS